MDIVQTFASERAGSPVLPLVLRKLPILILSAFCLLALVIVFKNPIEIGGDEGMEFSKELLIDRQPTALSAAWNDQQWFFSSLFGHIFGIVGFHPAIPRLFALFCSVTYCCTLRRMMPKSASTWSHVCAILLFLSYPTVIVLSMSGMLELPATVLALIGSQALFRPAKGWKIIQLFSAGMLVGAAIQIKLTAGMVFGAATLAFGIHQVATYCKERETRVFKAGCLDYLIWLAGLTSTFLVLVLLSPEYSIDHLWMSHARAAAHIPLNQIASFSFGWQKLMVSTSTSVAFLVGVVYILNKRIQSDLWLLPVCYGICATIVHFIHRPFWEYYYLHFAAAFTPIAGWVYGEALQSMQHSRRMFTYSPRISDKNVLATMGIAALCALWSVTDAKRANVELSDLLRIRPAREDPIVKLLNSLSNQINWAFGRDNSTVAAAGLLMVPELTILPKKRFWDGFTEEDVIAIVRARKPEVLILGRAFEEVDARWRPLLTSSYERAMQSEVSVVYVGKAIKVPGFKSTKEQLKDLGL